jgi:prepilin-type N-terminal cleavage/methylation domain-containing protein/prepilin-type processing-associated H-X9-DG protein
MRTRRAFSLAELLVVVGILGILIAILLPYVEKVRETARRAQCTENLRDIMVALRSYANANGHNYPSTTFDHAHTGYTAYTGADSLDPFSKDTAVKANDVTASLWLLVREGYAPARSFVCPSSGDEVDPMRSDGEVLGPDKRSNFTSSQYLSYSYSSPFSSAPGYRMNDTQKADFALMADMNPGVIGPAFDAPPFELAKANSNNHRKAGQNVLYADGHVSFQSTPYCGTGVGERRDNIYTARAPIPLPASQLPPPESTGFFGHDVSPAGTDDSYLVPADDD